MHRHRDRSFARAETGVSAAIESGGADPQAVVGAVADVLARDLDGSGREGAAMLSSISALACAAARAATRSRGDMRCVAQGFLVGVALAGRDKERDLISVIRHSAGTLIKHVHEAGGDPAAAARGLAEAASAWAAELRLDPAAAARAAARGAVEAADDVGGTLAASVREALREPLAAAAVLEPSGVL